MQREIEAAGIATITLSNIPDLTASVSPPRVVAIEHPFGQTVGHPNDRDGQLAVLRQILQAATEMDQPGSFMHLPFEWKESIKASDTYPPEPAPIVTYLQKRPWLFPKLLSRDVPK